MTCLRAELCIAAFLDGVLFDPWRRWLLDHVVRCPACATLLAVVILTE